METKHIKEIEGHRFEWSYSSTGSIDPWSLDFCETHHISLVCTADVAFFILVDGNEIWKEKGYGSSFQDEEFKCYEDCLAWLEKNCRYEGTLEESLKSLKEYKERCDARKKN